MKIAIGLSGGVDSAVAAGLLVRQGHEVIGIFMRNWEESDGECPATADWQDAMAVAAALDIPCYSVNFTAEYRERVFSSFLRELQLGRTPNPDVLCNTQIKFAAFLDYALTTGAERLATGHYAGVDCHDGSYRLLRAADENKDQTYFLHGLDQTALSRAAFPLADYTKDQVRALAAEWALPVAEKKDSTGICFIGERNFRAFLAQHLPTTPGPMVDETGAQVGQHQGLAFYTLGQRRGLGLGGAGERWFVVDKDLAANTLRVTRGQPPELFTHGLTIDHPHFIAGHPPGQSFAVTARIRHRQPLQTATMALADDGGARVTFDAPQRAVTPGQYCVLYQNQVCLGGGVIDAKGEPCVDTK